MKVKEIRRQNLRQLARKLGGASLLAQRLSKTQSQISHLIGNNPVKNIGDNLAEEIEELFNLPIGWMDCQHLTTNDEKCIYQKKNIPTYYVPLINIENFITKEYLHDYQNNKYVVTDISISNDSFALKVENDSMEAPNGVSFPNGSIIIVDPQYEVTNGAYVLAKIPFTEKIIFKQLVIDGNKHYLKSLNSRFPLIEIKNEKIIGVIRSLIMQFK